MKQLCVISQAENLNKSRRILYYKLSHFETPRQCIRLNSKPQLLVYKLQSSDLAGYRAILKRSTGPTRHRLRLHPLNLWRIRAAKEATLR